VASLSYYLRRLTAIGLGLALTGYSAWASWSHHHDLIGPLAAISAAGFLCFAEYAWHDRNWFHFGVLGILGIAAAVFSGSVVLERVSSTNEARVHQARSANLPRTEARKALTEAKETLKAAEAAVQAETNRKDKPGCGLACKGLKQDAEAARQRVDEARAKLVGLGAETAENPAARMLGSHAETFQMATLLGLPLWLELAAPAVLAYGFAPGRRKAPEPKPKEKRRKKKRETVRKPAAQDGVADWCEAYRQKHGRDPKVADVTKAFRVSRTTAWRRLRSVS